MEVKRGYRQTDIGVIPEDWSLRTLGEVVTFLDGQRRPVKNADRSKMRGDIPYYGASGVVGYVNDYLFDEDLILLGEDGENILSRASRLAFRISGQSWVNNHAHVLRPNRDISIGFLTEYLESLNYEQLNSGTAQPKLTKKTCSGIRVAVPPSRAEQDAIAEALSHADALIDSVEKLLTKRRQVKQGAMQELLTGKKRLPGFEGNAKFQQTDIGLIPADWRLCRLDEVGDSLIGLTYAPSDVDSDGVLVLRASNIQDGRLTFDDNVFVRMSIPERLMVRSGDILVCVRNGSRNLIGKSARIDERARGMTFGAFMAVFRSRSHAFVFHQFQSSVLRRQIHEHLGATINQITNKSINSFVVPMPPTDAEKDAIAVILTDMDAEVDVLEAKLDKARQIKQGMIQELLTGRTRLV